VARALAKQTVETPGAAAALKVALAHLEDASRKSSEMGDGETYFLAALALAAEEAGEPARAEVARARLRALARTERGETSWPNDSTSPFHTWGRAGAIEVTALAAQAMLRTGRDREIADSALLFLLKRKEATGLWFSGHATTRVLEALLAGFPEGDSGTVRILVNGMPLDDLSSASGALDPISVDLSKVLRAGRNEIVLTATRGGAATAHLASAIAPGRAARRPTTRAPRDVRRHGRGRADDHGERLRREDERPRARDAARRGGAASRCRRGPGPPFRARPGLRDGVYQYEVQPDRVLFYVAAVGGSRAIGVLIPLPSAVSHPCSHGAVDAHRFLQPRRARHDSAHALHGE
jgi:hypothetical protein